jgi:hypothetical protein
MYYYINLVTDIIFRLTIIKNVIQNTLLEIVYIIHLINMNYKL